MKNKLKHITNNAKETQGLGKKLAKEILKTRALKTALIIGLEGDLGSGKTTFLQGFAKGLGIKEKILSPTFVILKHFKIIKSQIPNPKSQINSKFQIPNFKFTGFYHIDCYRVYKPKEMIALNFKKIVSDNKNIIAIEWPERIRKILPKKTIWIKFKFINKNRREIIARY